MFDFKWSASEKKVARQAYERALEARLERLMTQFKARAAAATTPADVWAVEEFLREQRQDIERTFDYRYSQLPLVFARLILAGLMDEADLKGLADDKLGAMRRILEYARDDGR